VIAIGMEIRLGSIAGPLNIAIPSLAVKMMHPKCGQQWISRRAEPSAADQEKMLRLLEPTETDVEIAHDGARIRMQDLLALRSDDVLLLDLPSDGAAGCFVNGKDRFRGHVAQFGSKCVFVVDEVSLDA